MELSEKQLKDLNDKLELSQNLLNEISNIINPRQKMVKIVDPKKKIIKPSIQMKKLIDFWNGCGMARHPSQNAKTYQHLVKRLRKFQINGNFFNKMECYRAYHNHKFTNEEIYEAIRRFALMATNPDYDPPDGSYKDHLKSMNFLNFLYNGHAKKIKSYFVYCLENEPKLLAKAEERIEETKPQITIELKKAFIKTILGGITPEFSKKQKNDFINCSNRLFDFYIRNKSKLNLMAFSGIGGSAESVLAGMLVNSVVNNVGEQNIGKITTGYLCSDLTFSQRLPAYLNNQGITNRR